MKKKKTKMGVVSDFSLVTQVTVFHNRRAFDRLVVKYQSSIRRFFLSQTCGNEQLSDDLAQETFVKAYVNIKQFRGQASFSTWLYRIAYNVLYDHHRREKSNTISVDEAKQVKAIQGSSGGASALSIDLNKALSLLSDNERTCVTLQLIEGQPIDRISTITGMNANTVKSHLSRGKHKLATFLKENGYR